MKVDMDKDGFKDETSKFSYIMMEMRVLMMTC